MTPASVNYHLMIDEKFIDGFAKEALSITKNNKFIFTFSPPSKYVKTADGIHAPYDTKELDSLLSHVTADDQIFIHWYSSNVNSIFDKIPLDTKVFLCFWGGDFLESPFFSHPENKINHFLYDPLTLKVVKKRAFADQKQVRDLKNKSAKESGNVKNRIATHFLNIKQSAKSLTSSAFNAGMEERRIFLNRIEAVCHWNSFDIKILNKLYNVSLKQRYFVYPVGTDNLRVEQGQNTKDSAGLTIWLGNSDTETNNHLDALTLLSKWKNLDIKIICPLNYGNKLYAQLVAEFGAQIFGTKFKPILEFMPRDEYYALMDEVDIVYMPHNRGQAGGNLFAFIKKGKKVFMKKQSSIYRLFKSLGMHIYDSENLMNTDFKNLKSPLNQVVIDINIEILNSSVSNKEKRLKALKEVLLNG